jgi:glycoprotein 2-beta-D-xylosyltransferase
MFIRRGNYQRRPGHSGGLDMRLSNEDEISRELHAWAGTKRGITIVDARLEKMGMKDQLDLVHKSCIILGAHG